MNAVTIPREVMERLSHFYTIGESLEWLCTPHRLLDGARPIDLIRDGRERDVIAVLESLDAGTHT